MVTHQLFKVGGTLFGKLLATSGANSNDNKTRLELRRQDSHASTSNKVRTKEECMEIHIIVVKEVSDVITKETSFSDIANRSILVGELWVLLPKTQDSPKGMEVDALLPLIDHIDKERSAITKIGVNVSPKTPTHTVFLGKYPVSYSDVRY